MKKQDFNTILKQGMSVDACTCGELRRAARAVTLLYDKAFESSGLLSTQLGVLHTIYNSASITISQLAGELDMDRTTLTRNLSVLERQGLINISSGKDHRTRIITITSKGTNSMANAIPLWNEIQRKVKQQMGEKAWHELIQSLSHFVKIAERLLPPDKN
ncbi:MAG TPA: MarR family winged helix-turn-helix transcriptional regulator [Nitrososphaeraceae archaeon]|nr:MarR family winged helix-turn-helix transcriptional regulator [Nitrososphaeraceae archaeon]